MHPGARQGGLSWARCPGRCASHQAEYRSSFPDSRSVTRPWRFWNLESIFASVGAACRVVRIAAFSVPDYRCRDSSPRSSWIDHDSGLDYDRACSASASGFLIVFGARAMEERATSRSTSVASAIINSSVWFWLSIAPDLLLCLVEQPRLRAQSETTGSGGQLSRAPVEPGDVHALARLEPASGLIIVGARPGARIEQDRSRPGRQRHARPGAGDPRGA